VWLGAEGISLGYNEARTMCETYLNAYARTLAQGKAYWVQRETAQGLVQDLLESLLRRERAKFLNTRTVLKAKKRTFLLDGVRTLGVSAAQRSAVLRFMDEFAQTQSNPSFYKVLDVSRRVAGTGSLGLDRYAILVHGKGSPDGNYLLDLKQTPASSLVAHLKAVQPRWKSQAHRVVALQQRLQAVSMAFLQPVLFQSKPYIIRALQPSEDRVNLGRASNTVAERVNLMDTMGKITAWAHLRSTGRQGSAIADELIDFGQRKKWKDKLLLASEASAAQVRQDFSDYSAAYDAGFFNK
jgi:uncharacterized protein (DUF2252 family)